jgi:hypothetical protein
VGPVGGSLWDECGALEWAIGVFSLYSVSLGSLSGVTGLLPDAASYSTGLCRVLVYLALWVELGGVSAGKPLCLELKCAAHITFWVWGWVLRELGPCLAGYVSV